MSVVHASRISRLAAATLDALTLSPFYLLRSYERGYGNMSRGALIILAVVALSQLYLLSTRGQTVGKMLMKIKIVRYPSAVDAGFLHAVLLRGIVFSIVWGLVTLLFVIIADYCVFHTGASMLPHRSYPSFAASLIVFGGGYFIMYILPYAFILLKGRRGLHDRFAGTAVVRIR